MNEITCIDNKDVFNQLTIGKTYTLEGIDGENYIIINDLGKKYITHYSRFVTENVEKAEIK